MRDSRENTYSPALPPCDMSHEKIRALYTGRFIVMPWESLRAVASVAFQVDGERRLKLIIEASRGGVGRRHLREALADYLILLRATESIGEEAKHHADLVRTSLWSMVNGSAVCERLHLIHAQGLSGRRSFRQPLCRALGRALRLHLFRRYLYSQMWPLVEVLFFLPKLISSKPFSALNDFEVAYGEEAGDLAEALWKLRIERAEDRQQALSECSSLLLGALDYRILASGGWFSLLDQTLGMARRGPQPSSLSNHVLGLLREQRRGHVQTTTSLTLVTFILEYLWRMKSPGLVWTLTKMALSAFGASLLPLVTRLLRKDPYAIDAADIDTAPGLRVHLGEEELIIDPPAMTRFGSRLNHVGMENQLTPLSTSGYAADQFILRRVSEFLTDPRRIWAPRLQDFLRRWARLSEADWHSIGCVLAEIDPLINRIAGGAFSSEELSEDRLYGKVIDFHEEAKRTLLRAVASENAEGGSRSPINVMLHAYYIHGL